MMSEIDWSATGAMLQGIGTILGALAVLVAAAIGGTTFNTLKKQQLLQRQIDLAEKTLAGVFKAREVIAVARSPLIHAAELEEAKEQIANQDQHKSLTESQRKRFEQAQAYLNRMNQSNHIFLDLEELKALTFAYFGEDVTKEIDEILKVVSAFRWNANFYAEDDGSDRVNSRNIRRALTSSRVEGDVDEYAKRVDQAISSIERHVTPVLRDASTRSTKLIDELPSTLTQVLIQAVIPFR